MKVRPHSFTALMRAYIMLTVCNTTTDLNRDTVVVDDVPDDITRGTQVTEAGLDTGSKGTLWYHRTALDDSSFDKNGYNREWIHSAGYSDAGFDPWGFDKRGLDFEGFGRSGFSLKGFDRFGNHAAGRWAHKNFWLEEEDYLRGNDAIDKSRTSIGQVDTANSDHHINESGPQPDEPGNEFGGEHNSQLAINDAGGDVGRGLDTEQINGEGGDGVDDEFIETNDSDIDDGEGMIDEQSGVESNKASWVENCQGCDTQTPLYLECGNRFCPRCITKWFETALQDASRFPVKCCQRRLRAPDYQFLPGSLVAKYQVREAEFDCPNPIYCSNPRCSALIPIIRLADDNYAYCNTCAQRTCARCKLGRPEHFPHGNCPSTFDQNRLLKLDMASDWRLCKSCNRLIEKNGGCNHIT